MSLGSEGFCYDVSDSFAQMLGHPKSAFMANNWFRLVHIEDRDTVRTVADILQRQAVPRPVRIRFLDRYDDPICLEVRFLKRRDRRRSRCGEDRIIANVRRLRGTAA
jgi:hypothetical protein